MLRTLALLCLLTAALASCGAGRMLPAQRTASPVVSAAGAPRIAVIVMENKGFGDVLGSRSSRYVNALARHYAVATQMYGVSHPSLPNYLSLTGGSTFGISSDCTDCKVHATSLVDQLAAHGISWRAYMEGLPRSCFTGAGSGGYAKRHDPFLYYTRVTGDPARCSHVVPLSRLAADERAGALPRYTWITPDLCHDTHDCDVATGDRFLSGLVPRLLRSLGSHGLLILTWDEGTNNDGCCRLASGGHIVTILAGGLAKAGARMAIPVDHYSVLQTTEDLLRLPRLRGAACACTPSLAPLLSAAAPRHR